MLENPSENMPPSARVLALRHESRRTSEVALSKTKVVMKVTNSEFRTALAERNIYIDEEDPSTQLVTQAEKIMSEPHDSSEMDDATVVLLKDALKTVATGSEQALIYGLGTKLFPAMAKAPDRRIAVATNDLWDHAILIAIPPWPDCD